jgi:acylphosphatase
MDRVARRFIVTGKVQGVYFRHSTRLEAERLGIRGVARNLPDGSVEVIAQGTDAAVETLRQWLRHGPPMARVAQVTELEPASDGDAERCRDAAGMEGRSGIEPASFSTE